MSASRPRPGDPLQPAHRTFAALVLIQSVDVAVHLIAGMLETLRISASVMLVVGAWMILTSPNGAPSVGVANAFAFLVLNGVFVAVQGITNPQTGNLRLPMMLFVVASLVTLALHVRASQKTEQV